MHVCFTFKQSIDAFELVHELVDFGDVKVIILTEIPRDSSNDSSRIQKCAIVRRESLSGFILARSLVLMRVDAEGLARWMLWQLSRTRGACERRWRGRVAALYGRAEHGPDKIISQGSPVW